MPGREGDRSAVASLGAAAAILTTPKTVLPGGIVGHVLPSVGRFTANKIPFSLEVNGSPVGVKPIDKIAARSIAPTCTFGVFNTQVLERPMKGPSYGPALTKCTRPSPCALF